MNQQRKGVIKRSSQAPTIVKTPKVFISYKWQDSRRNAWVERFYTDLRKHGIDARLDKYEVPPGKSFSDYMTRSIREVDYVVFIITPQAVKSVESDQGAVAFEMQISNARRLSGKGEFSIIPVFREGKATTTYLADHRYIDFRNNNQYDIRLEELVNWLLGQVIPPPLGRNPFLRHYSESSTPPLVLSGGRFEHADRLIKNGWYSGEHSPSVIKQVLRYVKEMNIFGFSTENIKKRVTWVKEGERGQIELDESGLLLNYRRVATDDMWPEPWRKNFFRWTLKWSGKYGVAATYRMSQSPIDRLSRYNFY
jgi:TIR domain